MNITYFGHNCFLINTMGKSILIDPFISGNSLAANISVSSIKADFIILTHGHTDHVLDTLEIAKNNPNTTLVAIYEITEWYSKEGVKLVHPMNIGGEKEFEFGKLKMVQAVHSSTLPDGSPGGNPAGFLLINSEASLYIAGDTALTMDMKLIPIWAPNLTAAILPIGDNFTMGYKDAALAAEFVGTTKVIGAHFDTFGYIKIDHKMAKAHFESKGLELNLLEINQTIQI